MCFTELPVYLENIKQAEEESAVGELAPCIY